MIIISISITIIIKIIAIIKHIIIVITIKQIIINKDDTDRNIIIIIIT